MKIIVIAAMALVLALLVASQVLGFNYVAREKLYKDAKIIIVKNKASYSELNDSINAEADKFKFCEIVGFHDSAVVMVCSNEKPLLLSCGEPVDSR